jgi:hypothetical protein
MKPGPETDRTETAVFGVLMGAFMAVSPFVAYAAGRWAQAKFSREAQVQRAALGQVPATLLESAPLSGPGGAVFAQWRLPNGQLRTGSVSAPGGAAAGTTLMVWVNQAGELTDPPMGQPEIANRTELAQGSAAALFAVALAAIGRQAHQSLHKRRTAAGPSSRAPRPFAGIS